MHLWCTISKWNESRKWKTKILSEEERHTHRERQRQRKQTGVYALAHSFPPLLVYRPTHHHHIHFGVWRKGTVKIEKPNTQERNAEMGVSSYFIYIMDKWIVYAIWWNENVAKQRECNLNSKYFVYGSDGGMVHGNENERKKGRNEQEQGTSAKVLFCQNNGKFLCKLTLFSDSVA